MKFEIIRHMDKMGRIVIPKDYRRSMGLNEETEILVLATEEGILLQKKERQEDGLLKPLVVRNDI